MWAEIVGGGSSDEDEIFGNIGRGLRVLVDGRYKHAGGRCFHRDDLQ
jgi:hypothetical protein